MTENGPRASTPPPYQGRSSARVQTSEFDLGARTRPGGCALGSLPANGLGCGCSPERAPGGGVKCYPVAHVQCALNLHARPCPSTTTFEALASLDPSTDSCVGLHPLHPGVDPVTPTVHPTRPPSRTHPHSKASSRPSQRGQGPPAHQLSPLGDAGRP